MAGRKSGRMTLKTVIELLRNEAECVKSAGSCDRDCGKCSLVKPTKDILEMYEAVINVLEKSSCKNCIHLGHAYKMPCKNCRRNQMLPDWYEVETERRKDG